MDQILSHENLTTLRYPPSSPDSPDSSASTSASPLTLHILPSRPSVPSSPFRSTKLSIQFLLNSNPKLADSVSTSSRDYPPLRLGVIFVLGRHSWRSVGVQKWIRRSSRKIVKRFRKSYDRIIISVGEADAQQMKGDEGGVDDDDDEGLGVRPVRMRKRKSSGVVVDFCSSTFRQRHQFDTEVMLSDASIDQTRKKLKKAQLFSFLESALSSSSVSSSSVSPMLSESSTFVSYVEELRHCLNEKTCAENRKDEENEAERVRAAVAESARLRKLRRQQKRLGIPQTPTTTTSTATATTSPSSSSVGGESSDFVVLSPSDEEEEEDSEEEEEEEEEEEDPEFDIDPSTPKPKTINIVGGGGEMSEWDLVKLYVEKRSLDRKKRRTEPIRHIVIVTDMEGIPGMPGTGTGAGGGSGIVGAADRIVLVNPRTETARVGANFVNRVVLRTDMMERFAGNAESVHTAGHDHRRKAPCVSISCIAIRRANVGFWSTLAMQGGGNFHYSVSWSDMLRSLSKELNGLTTLLSFSDVRLELFPLNGLKILKKGISGCPEARRDESLRREALRAAKGSVLCPVGYVHQGEIHRIQVKCSVPRVRVPERNVFLQAALRFKTTTSDVDVVIRESVRLEVSSSKVPPILPNVFRSGTEIQKYADVFRALGTKICSGGLFWRKKLAGIKSTFKKHMGNDPSGHFEKIVSRFFATIDKRALGKGGRALEKQQEMGRAFYALGCAVDASSDYGYLSGHDSDAGSWSDAEEAVGSRNELLDLEEEEGELSEESEGDLSFEEVGDIEFDELLIIDDGEEEAEGEIELDDVYGDDDDDGILIIGENEDFDEDEMEGETPFLRTRSPDLATLGFGVPLSPTGTSPGADFKVMNPADLALEQQSKIVAVADAIHSSVGVAAKLLRHYQWNQQKLCLEYVADREEVCREAGVTLSRFPVRVGEIGQEMECCVCFGDYPGEDMYALACEHFFCRGCWERHLHVKIADGPDCLRSKCQFRDCGKVVVEELVREVCSVDDAALFNRYYLRSLVEDNPKVKWCPAPDCGRAVHCPDAEVENVRCVCGEMFCFKCGNEAHQPASCEEMDLWKEKAEGDHSAKVWIAENTKPCPRCKKNIEKNGGCNHMTCSQCGYQFCWFCLGNWIVHEIHGGGCFLMSASESKRRMERKAQKADVVEARRFLEVYERFKEQGVSQEFEREMNRKVAEMGAELRQRQRYSAWTELKDISAAAAVLLDCRRAMKYSYVKGFLLRPGPEKELFDHLQSELFHTTEKLAELLERDFDNWNRDEVNDLVGAARTRLRNMFEGVKGGLTNVSGF